MLFFFFACLFFVLVFFCSLGNPFFCLFFLLVLSLLWKAYFFIALSLKRGIKEAEFKNSIFLFPFKTHLIFHICYPHSFSYFFFYLSSLSLYERHSFYCFFLFFFCFCFDIAVASRARLARYGACAFVSASFLRKLQESTRSMAKGGLITDCMAQAIFASKRK